MTWTMLDTWIVVAGMLSAMACALLGNFLVLRRMSMMGDAISHAVLPGLAVAFLLTGSRASLPMFLGAAVVGVLTAVFIEWVRRFGAVEESAAMGVVFTSLFALGLILLVQGANQVDLDPGCVLYGAIELVPLDTRPVFGVELPRAVVTLGIVFGINCLAIFLFYKELKITSFDPSLATTLGVNATLVNYGLMTLVAVTAVAAFETVGSILVIAMLIVPAAAAYLLTERLATMIVISLVLGAACAALGHLAAIQVPTWFGHGDTSTAGMMGAVAGVIFLTVMLLAPQQGVISRLVHRASLSLGVIKEDVLGLLYRCEELGPVAAPPLTARFIGAALDTRPLVTRLVLARLAAEGQVQHGPGTYSLTDHGRVQARNLVRTHRLWETYLHRFLHLPADHVHPPAERLEHVTSAAMQQELAEKLGPTPSDPHGKQVPGQEPRPGSTSES